ncbi:MAG: hypothetical protein HYR91_06370 [Flavobacteriia bacterium]|nr:hypothetical protein [Flavobacteriia bacterium]
MKLLLVIVIIISSFNLNSQLSQNEKYIGFVNTFLNLPLNTPLSNENQYLLFRTENMFTIQQLDDSKINEYPILNSIEVADSSRTNVALYNPTEFISLFNEQKINPLFINIVRSKTQTLYYRIGNTKYILVCQSEDLIVKNFNEAK